MNKYMKQAFDKASDGVLNKDGGPFGAVVVSLEGEVLASCSNMVLKNCDPTAHAEIMAIREACLKKGSHDLSGCSLYTTCFPCPMCLSAIIWSNIKKVYYGNTKEDAAAIGFRDDFIYDFIEKLSKDEQDITILDLKSMNREETIEEFNKFKNKKDKIVY